MKESKPTASRTRRTKSSTSSNARNKAKNKTVSPNKCPEGMSLKDWQIALRRQVVEKERLVVVPPTDSEYFNVSNPETGQTYQVFYKGARSKWNYCSCLDFKTNRLGTCKHIEAITLANGGAYAAKRYAMPDYTSVYLDYRAGKQLKVRVAPHRKTEFETLVDRYFDKEGVALPESILSFDSFISQARAIDPRFTIYDDALDYVIDRREQQLRRAIDSRLTDDEIRSILNNTTLYPYQVEGVRFAFKAGRSINADEMGLGKTIQAIATAELMRREGLVESIMIFCPTSLKYQWMSEISRFTDASVIAVEGNPLQRRKQYAADAAYKICSYNSAARDIKSGVALQADFVIFDEIQRLKNWDTQIARYMRRVNSRHMMALSGTPLENKLNELYSVMNFVDPFCLGPYYKFIDDTTVADDSGRVVGYKNLNEVAERLKGRLLRRRKKDVAIQMPERTDTNLFVPMTPEQMDIHEEYQKTVARLVYKWRRFHFLSETDRRRLLLSLSMMRMVCDSTYVLDQTTRFDTKVDEVMHMVSNILESDDPKIVIFSQWERMLRIVASQLEKRGVMFGFLHGGVASRKRKQLIDDFQNNPECRVFLSTDAGSTGLNLQAASTMINLDLPWNPAVLEQRIARIYRLGQGKPVHVIKLISRSTIEERMLATLQFKTGLFEGILDGGDDTVFIEQNRFDKIIEMVETQLLPEATDAERPTVENSEMEEHIGEFCPVDIMPDTPGNNDSASQPDDSADGVADAGTDEAGPDADRSERRESSPRNGRVAIDGEQLVAQGITFLSHLADALKTPESTKELVDSMTRTDRRTGETTITIPVPDKSTLTTLLTALGTLLNRN